MVEDMLKKNYMLQCSLSTLESLETKCEKLIPMMIQQIREGYVNYQGKIAPLVTVVL